MNHKELLILYRGYVDNCIENTTDKTPIRPMSFDEWYHYVYLTDKAELEADRKG